MEFFRRKKKQISPLVQTVSSRINSSHPFNILDRYEPFSFTEYRWYSSLREAVPIIDAAISKILRLVGDFEIQCDNYDIQYVLNKFLANVQVNSCVKGANNFLLSHLNQLLTYGTAVGEIVINSQNNSIAALYNASLEDVKLKLDDNPLNVTVYKKKSENYYSKIKYPELILISALNPDPGKIYGSSIMKGLPFVSNILLKIYNSIGINWERLGNIRFAVTSSAIGDRNKGRICLGDIEIYYLSDTYLNLL